MVAEFKKKLRERGIPTTYRERQKLKTVLYADDLANARRENPLSFIIQEIDILKELALEVCDIKSAIDCMKEIGKLLRYSQANPLLDALDNGELSPDDVGRWLDNYKAKQEVKQITKQAANGKV